MTKKKAELNEDGAAADTLKTKGLPANGGAADLEDGSGVKKSSDDASQDGIAAGTIKMKGPVTTGVREELTLVFEGSGISEEVVEKTKTLFEAAVNARVAAEAESLHEDFQNQLDEQVESIRTELTENVDKYLDYVASQWMEENKIAISNSLKLELFGEFQTALKKLFVEHYIEIPDDKLDVLADMTAKAEVLETKLDEQVDKNIELTAQINKLKANDIFKNISEGMVKTDVEKFKTLAGDLLEGTSDEQDLTKKLSVIRESHFKVGGGKPAAKQIDLNEDVVTIVTDKNGKTSVTPSPEMASIVAAINRTTRAI
jgi:vacuolar-type H+-ATPase subunit E/Vma4